jgi:hypothetical protein
MIGVDALERAAEWRPRAPTRALSSSECSLLPPILASGVDFSRVRIVKGWHTPLAAMARVTIVRGRRIFWAHAPGEARTLAERAHLAHELTHVWQHMALKRTGPELLAERRYRYVLAPGKPFVGYGYEQQAAIVEDYVRIVAGAGPRWTRAPAPIADYRALLGFS